MTSALEEGLDHSANKRGLTGKERHRYIGGALHNMGKAKTRSGKREAAPAHKPASHTATTHKATPAPSRKQHAPSVKRGTSPAPGRTATTRKPGKTGFRPNPREKLVLTVRVNKAASEKVPNHIYQMYSIYKGKEQYSSKAFRKMAAAKAEAKIEMDRHNHPRGLHSRPGFL